jgi:hypothetical protein
VKDIVALPSNMRHYGRQHLKLASDWMKTWYDKLANSTSYQEGDRVWLYCPTCIKGKSPKLQSSWEGPYKIVTWLNDVVYRLQKNPRSKMMVEHLDQLALYQGAAWDKCTWRGSSHSGWHRKKKKKKSGKETTRTTKESDVTIRNLRKKGMVIRCYAIRDKQP